MNEEVRVFSADKPITLADFAPSKEAIDKVLENTEGDTLFEDEGADDLLGIPSKEDDESDDDGDEKDEEEEEGEEEKEPSERSYLDIGEFEGLKYRVELPDGNYLEVPANAKIFNKVDGKYQPFELREQMGAASGTVAINKRLQELNLEKESVVTYSEKVQEREAELTGSLQTFITSLRSDDPEQGILALSAVLDIEPGTLLDSIIGMGQIVGTKIFEKELIPKFKKMGINVDEMFNSSDPKVVAYRNALLQAASKEAYEERNQKYKGQRSQKVEEREATKLATNQEVHAYAVSKLETLGISEDDVLFAEKVLKYKNDGAFEEIQALRGTSPKKYIDAMTDHALHYKKAIDIDTAVQKFNPALKKVPGFYEKVAKIYVPGKHSVDQLDEIIKGLGADSNRKVVQVQKKRVAERLQNSYSVNKGNKMSFSNIDDFRKLIPK